MAHRQDKIRQLTTVSVISEKLLYLSAISCQVISVRTRVRSFGTSLLDFSFTISVDVLSCWVPHTVCLIPKWHSVLSNACVVSICCRVQEMLSMFSSVCFFLNSQCVLSPQKLSYFPIYFALQHQLYVYYSYILASYILYVVISYQF